MRRGAPIRALAILCLFAANHPWVHASTGTPVNVDNVYYPLNAERFAWTVWIAEPQGTLQQIKCVEYTLHPTFPSPVRKQCDRSRAFSLSTAGWGEFTLGVRVLWQDGNQTKQSYRLDLSSPERKVSGATHLAFPAMEVHRLLPGEPALLRSPDFGKRVAALLAGRVIFRAAHTPKPFRVYCYIAPSALAAPPTALEMQRKGRGTTISQLPARVALPLGQNEYSAEVMEADQDGSIIVAVR
jgi:hypothetical protein